MISLAERATSFPPMNTAGTAGLHPSSLKAHSISLPLALRSSSWIAGLAPRSYSSVFTLWHIQHELFVKTTTAFSDAKSLMVFIFNKKRFFLLLSNYADYRVEFWNLERLFMCELACRVGYGLLWDWVSLFIKGKRQKRRMVDLIV